MLAKITGMTCSHCSTTVENTIIEMQGVLSVKVNLDSSLALIELLPSIDYQCFIKDLTYRVDAIGFEIECAFEDENSFLLTPSEQSSQEISLDANTIASSLPMTSSEIKFKVSQMSCQQCVLWVRKELEEVFGTDNCMINLNEGSCCISSNHSDTYSDIHSKVSIAVSKAGFECGPWRAGNTAPRWSSFGSLNQNTITLSVGGMSCASCSNRVESSLSKLDGVDDAQVNFLTGKALVTLRAASDEEVQGLITPQQITTSLIESVEQLGYTASILLTSDGDTIACLLAVSGIVCDSCPGRIEKLLSTFGGVSEVSVKADSGSTYALLVIYDGLTANVGPRAFIKCLETAGYHAKLSSDKENKDNHMEKETANAKQLLLWGLLFTVPLAVVMMVLPPAGVHEVKSDVLPTKQATLPFHALIGFLFATPVQFGVGYGFYVRAFKALRQGGTNMDVLIALGTSVAYFYSAVLVVGGLFGEGLRYRHYYFETSAILITFVALGKYLEAMTKQGTGSAVRALLELKPDEACIIQGEVLTLISTALLQRGDVVLVKAGERLPCDAVLTKVLGQSASMDESMLTGEAMPVCKEVGDETLAGTFNSGGPVWITATKVGPATALQGIIRLVEQAQLSKAPIQFYADYVSSRFVPFVVLTAVLTMVGWAVGMSIGVVSPHWYKEEGPVVFCLLFAVSVLVIACPCALGLAVPTAVMVGSGVGASLGVLIKGGSALETTHSVQVLVFDKTGTLTYGTPLVTTVQVFEHPQGMFPVCIDSKVKLLFIAGSCEAVSEHPLAQAVRTAANHACRAVDLCEVEDFESDVGSGIKCKLKGAWAQLQALEQQEQSYMNHVSECVLTELASELEVFIGSRSYMNHASECVLTEPQDNMAKSLEDEGQTVVFVVLKQEGLQHMAGFIAIADSVREEAKATVRQLHALGLEVWMASGDNRRTADAIARKVGIVNVLAQVKPEDKANKMRELKRGGKVVAMVGDGVNDSPAIAEADVGMAIGAGSDVAIETASVVLMTSDLRGVLIAIHLSKHVFRRIQINMAFSLGYNSLGIPIAAGCLFPLFKARMPPEVAALAMALSSVSVVLSSLHLKRYKPPKF